MLLEGTINSFSPSLVVKSSLSNQIETGGIRRECIMKGSLGFLDSCGTNAPAGLANEFNLSAQPFSFPIHILISCKWVFAIEAPVNKNTTCFLQFHFHVITPTVCVLAAHMSFGLRACCIARVHKLLIDNQLVVIGLLLAD